jgi:hypothetical protein
VTGCATRNSRSVEDLDLEAEPGVDVCARGRKARAADVEAARTALWELDDPGLPDDAAIVTLGGASYVYRPWGEDPAAERRALRRVIGTVKLAKATPSAGAGSRWTSGSSCGGRTAACPTPRLPEARQRAGCRLALLDDLDPVLVGISDEHEP